MYVCKNVYIFKNYKYTINSYLYYKTYKLANAKLILYHYYIYCIATFEKLTYIHSVYCLCIINFSIIINALYIDSKYIGGNTIIKSIDKNKYSI